MAEMQTSDSGGKKKHKKVRGKKLSTRVDMTPMVDLGFLLITFFMLTTTLQRPQAMELVVPAKPKPEDEKIEQIVKAGKVVTLLPTENDKLYWYWGLEEAKLDSTDYSPEGVRKILIEQKDRVAREYAGDQSSDVIVLIKPTNDASYRNMVDLLDEIHISGVKRYALMNSSKAEEDFIKNPTANLKELMAKY